MWAYVYVFYKQFKCVVGVVCAVNLYKLDVLRVWLRICVVCVLHRSMEFFGGERELGGFTHIYISASTPLSSQRPHLF